MLINGLVKYRDINPLRDILLLLDTVFQYEAQGEIRFLCIDTKAHNTW